MVVNIEKVSQWLRVWRNQFSREWKVDSVDNRGNCKIPVTQFGRMKLDGTIYPNG
jgi:hypothetical protein